MSIPRKKISEYFLDAFDLTSRRDTGIIEKRTKGEGEKYGNEND